MCKQQPETQGYKEIQMPHWEQLQTPHLFGTYKWQNVVNHTLRVKSATNLAFSAFLFCSAESFSLVSCSRNSVLRSNSGIGSSSSKRACSLSLTWEKNCRKRHVNPGKNYADTSACNTCNSQTEPQNNKYLKHAALRKLLQRKFMQNKVMEPRQMAYTFPTLNKMFLR